MAIASAPATMAEMAPDAKESQAPAFGGMSGHRRARSERMFSRGGAGWCTKGPPGGAGG
jgi:hypothetical protein